MNGLTIRFGATALKRALFLGVIGAILMSFAVAQAVTNTPLGTSSISLATETFIDDGDVTVVAQGVGMILSNAAAAGDSPTGLEIASTYVAINSALTKNNYYYMFDVEESGIDTLTTGENLKVSVYGDDGSTTTLLATLYMLQGSADPSNKEGATVTVDVGSTIHNNYDIVVERQ